MFHQMKLGRLSAPIPDGVPTLDDHPISQATAPPRLIRDHVPFRPTLGGNDQCGCCTTVALANAIIAQEALSGGLIQIPDANILKLYSTISGYTPGNEASDTGCVETDVLAWQAHSGFHIGDGTQDEYVGLWANVPADNFNLIALVTARMGCAYLGVDLALADQQGGGIWDTDSPASQGDPKPGSWGGHALLAFSYDSTPTNDMAIWNLVTWGYQQRATTRWLKSRLSEVHTVFHPQLMTADRKNFAGLDYDRLRADVESFGDPA